MHGPVHIFKDKIVTFFSKIGFAIGQGLEKSTPTLKKELERRAVNSSADYFMQKMSSTSVILNSHRELLDYAIGRARSDGSLLEFGVYQANTINYLADVLNRRSSNRLLWGFDSFEGLPSDWAGYVITKETFDLKGSLPKVRSNVRLVKGFFDQTLPNWCENNSEVAKNISLLHIDSDLYESCQTILYHLKTGIKPGCFILFDEYFNYPGWQHHEYLAFKEFIAETGLEYQYLACFEQKVLVEIK